MKSMKSMKLQAANRLLTAAAPDKGQLQTFLASLDFGSAPFKFRAMTTLRDLYPVLGVVTAAKFHWYVSAGSQDGKKLQIRISMEVNDSNSLYRRSATDPLHSVAEKELKKLGAALKQFGFTKFKLAPENVVGERRSPPKANCLVELGSASANPKPSPSAKAGSWGIEVTSGDGRRKHVFTGTENSMGPWASAEIAQHHVSDLKHQLEYDDDFKHPTFKVVQV